MAVWKILICRAYASDQGQECDPLWEILCLPASRRGTGFSREGGIYDDENVLNVLAASRLKPVPRHQ
jgi:hypothetical protein